jgi:hypothetical protein
MKGKWWAGLSDGQISAAITGAVMARYAPNEWFVFDEVVFSNMQRRVDFLAINAHDKSVEMVEAKASVQDARREFACPEKREMVAKYFSRTWLALPQGMMEAEDVPECWGVLSVVQRGNGFQARVIRKPPLNKDVKDFSALTLRSVLRRLYRSTYGPPLNSEVMYDGARWRKLWRYAGFDMNVEDLLVVADAAASGRYVRSRSDYYEKAFNAHCELVLELRRLLCAWNDEDIIRRVKQLVEKEEQWRR